MNINEAVTLALDEYQKGNIQQAESIFREILEGQPDHVEALHFLGVVYSQRGQFDLAVHYIQKALQIDSTYAEAHVNLGNIFQEKKKVDEAISCYKQAIKLNPNIANTYFNLGIALQDKGEVDESILCYQQALKLNLNIFGLYNNLGLALQIKGELDESIQHYQKALQINPHFADAWNNLGNAVKEKGQLDEAITCYQKALHINPNFADAYNNLGCVYKDKGQIDEAENCFRLAIRIKNDFSTAYSNLLLTMEYNAHHNPQDIFSEHIMFSKNYAERLASVIPAYKNERDSERKLKIGYVSPDFKRHPVACFIEPILMAHNRKYFKVFCYSNTLRHDEATKRIQKYSDQWRNIVGISDEEVAELIRKDQIDMLVDLAGHTADNRILLFAQKPAPIQISWIGYLATTGLPTMDYKIADNYTDPSGLTEQFYTERLMRLPESFLCYLPTKDSPNVGPSPTLSTGHITFGSFNNFPKITSEVFSVWARILNELPDSRLILKGKSFNDKATYEYAINMFTQRGLAAERITLQSWDPSPKHMESYNQVDIGLDTFPFNGAATTCEAMWMGVPVVTLAGTAYHSRVGISLLSNVGLPELVAKTLDEYISITVNIAKDLERLQLLRERLREMMKHSPLCDAERFIGNLEICYRNIWKMWCNAV
jgi:protein O-GlcNAc transferase